MAETESIKQHFSPVTKKWMPCGAQKRACRYVNEPHRFVEALVDSSPVKSISSAQTSEAITEVAEALAPQVERERKSFVKSMMTWFFGEKKSAQTKVAQSEDALYTVPESVSKAERVAAPAPKNQPNQEIGQVIEKNGRLEVLSEDDYTGTTGTTVYQFGNFTSLEEAKQLQKADPIKHYQNGECGVLAGELWHRNPHVVDFCIFSYPEDTVAGIHMFVKLEDGTYADSLGIWSEKEFTDYWKTIQPDVKLESYDDGEPVPEKDKDFDIQNQKLYDIVDGMINRRFAQK